MRNSGCLNVILLLLFKQKTYCTQVPLFLHFCMSLRNNVDKCAPNCYHCLSMGWGWKRLEGVRNDFFMHIWTYTTFFSYHICFYNFKYLSILGKEKQEKEWFGPQRYGHYPRVVMKEKRTGQKTEKIYSYLLKAS